MVNYLLMSFLLQNPLNSSELNSPPMSVRKHMIYIPVPFSTRFLKHLKEFKAYDLSTKK